jgi:hypothetical protein
VDVIRLLSLAIQFVVAVLFGEVKRLSHNNDLNGQ